MRQNQKQHEESAIRAFLAAPGEPNKNAIESNCFAVWPDATPETIAERTKYLLENAYRHTDPKLFSECADANKKKRSSLKATSRSSLLEAHQAGTSAPASAAPGASDFTVALLVKAVPATPKVVIDAVAEAIDMLVATLTAARERINSTGGLSRATTNLLLRLAGPQRNLTPTQVTLRSPALPDGSSSAALGQLIFGYGSRCATARKSRTGVLTGLLQYWLAAYIGSPVQPDEQVVAVWTKLVGIVSKDIAESPATPDC